MITSGVIITFIICVTVIIVCYIIAYSQTDDKIKQRIDDARALIRNFQYDNSSIENCEEIYTASTKDISCFIKNLKSIL